MHGQVAPGAALTLRGVAGEFGVSMTPAREAVRRLVAEGALKLSASGRVSTPELTNERIEELAALRALLEPELATRALPRAHVALIDRMAAINGVIDEMIVKGDAAGYVRSNLEFHRTLYLRAQAPAMLGLIETVWLQAGPTMRVLYERVQRRQASEMHRKIIAALRAGRRAGAAARDPHGRDAGPADAGELTPVIRRVMLVIVLLAAAVTAFFVFYHPPMRLMPPPLLFQDPDDAGRAAGRGARRQPDFAVLRHQPAAGRAARLSGLHRGARPQPASRRGAAQDRRRGHDLGAALPWSRGADPEESRPFVHLEAMREQASLIRGGGAGRGRQGLARRDRRGAGRAGGPGRDRLCPRRQHHGRAGGGAGGAARAFHRAACGRRALRLADGGELPALLARHRECLRRRAASRGPDRAAGVGDVGAENRRLHLQRRGDDRQRGAGRARARAAGDRRQARRGLPRGAGRGLPRVRGRPRRLRPRTRAGSRPRST